MKNWWESRTIWFNSLSLVASLLTVIATAEIMDGYPAVPFVIMGIIIPIINVFLRLDTGTSIKK